MDYGLYAMSPTWNYAGFPYYQTAQPVHNVPASPLEVRKLYSEQDILENSLANCVTFLQVLRKKHDRNERHLSTNPATPRKKRKQIQQTTRELKREILIREQEQATLLSNLQACRAKLYVAETLSYPSIGLLSSVPAFTSGSTRCTIAEESELTEISWNGWTDDAILSPFAKCSHNAFFVTEIAPEETSEKSIEETLPLQVDSHVPLATIGEGLGIIIPSAFPEVALPQGLLSLLSPKAEVFEPRTIPCFEEYDLVEERSEQPSIAKVLALRHLKKEQKRRATDGSTDTSLSPQLKPTSRFARNFTWCNNTPQNSPAKDVQGRPLITRKRTNSM